MSFFIDLDQQNTYYKGTQSNMWLNKQNTLWSMKHYQKTYTSLIIQLYLLSHLINHLLSSVLIISLAFSLTTLALRSTLFSLHSLSHSMNESVCLAWHCCCPLRLFLTQSETVVWWIPNRFPVSLKVCRSANEETFSRISDKCSRRQIEFSARQKETFISLKSIKLKRG